MLSSFSWDYHENNKTTFAIRSMLNDTENFYMHKKENNCIETESNDTSGMQKSWDEHYFLLCSIRD